jgi:hypothetical protein
MLLYMLFEIVLKYLITLSTFYIVKNDGKKALLLNSIVNGKGVFQCT